MNGVSVSDWTLFVDCSRDDFTESLLAIPIWQIAAIIVVAVTLSCGVIRLGAKVLAGVAERMGTVESESRDESS